MNKELNRKVINKLNHRTITKEHIEIIMDYLNGNINWLETHNKLIPIGIYFTEKEILLDY